MPITINGVAYEPREQPEKKQRSVESKEAAMFGLMASMLVAGYYGERTTPRKKRPDPLASIDIVAEFELIQRKESKLPRSQRDRVVWAFNKMYKQVKNK